MQSSTSNSISIIVLGARVVGMTCALKLIEQGYKVTIVARDQPGDLESTGWASPWAGGVWNSFAEEGTREAKWDVISFKEMMKISEEDSSIVQTVEEIRYFDHEPTEAELPWCYKTLCPDVQSISHIHAICIESLMKLFEATQARRLTPSEVSSRNPRAKAAIVYSTLSWNPARYIPYLKSRLTDHSNPVTFVRKHLSSIDEAFALVPDADILVNASGLGSASLIGVADPAVQPIRGQTVLIRVPEPFNRSMVADFKTYIIPRPCSSTGTPGKEAILGGCYEPSNWSTAPDLALAERIMKTCVKVFPELSKDGTVEGLEVLRHNVGLRPGREGGPRLELEKVVVPSLGVGVPICGVREGERKVVHAYGIGGAGYQASFGMAEEVAMLVKQSLSFSKL